MKRKKAVSLIIVLLGVTVSLLIVKGVSRGDQGVTVAFGNSANSNFDFESGAGAVYDPNTTILPNAEANLTETVVRLYGEELLKINEPGGAQMGNPIAVPTENVLDEILAEELSKEIIFPTFESKDIKTSDRNNLQGATDYLNEVSADYEKRFGGGENLFAAIANATTNQKTDDLSDQAEKFTNYINDLLSMTVPSQLQDFHLGFLNFWLKNKTLAETMLRSEEDPLKAAVATNALLNMFDEENALLEKLGEELKSFK